MRQREISLSAPTWPPAAQRTRPRAQRGLIEPDRSSGKKNNSGRDGVRRLASFSVLMLGMERGDGCPTPVSLETEAFADWYREVLPRVYGYLYKATGGDKARTENLTQETFLQAVRTLNRGEHRTLTIPWLMTVARSRLIDEARAESRANHRVELVRRSRGSSVDRSGLDLDDVYARELLAGLRPLERAALALRYIDDLPVSEVARELGRSIRATESILARARRRLRSRVEEAADA